MTDGADRPERIRVTLPDRDLTTVAVRQGRGPDVVLVPGAGAGADSWQGVAYALARRFTVWTYDPRGVGRAVDAAGDVDAPALAADLEALLDALGLAAVHLVGHSSGARAAIAVAAERPDRVRSVVGLCTWGWADDFLEHRFALVRHVVGGLRQDAARRALAYFLLSRPWQNDRTRYARFLAALGDGPQDAAWRGVVRHLLAPTGGDPDPAALPEVPALLLGTAEDRMIPAAYGRALAEAWPTATFARVGGEECGHLPHLEDPAGVAQAVSRFAAPPPPR